ncbi:type I restriction enzyme HsdR N-terminal domain-containing protein [Priestia megaterium]|uniref:type I restriction enzyme HsdR N-terminal domain-containing protein n=1 Tax=Priestia megaterium TaxID=1404 RepID=UPI00372D715D
MSTYPDITIPTDIFLTKIEELMDTPENNIAFQVILPILTEHLGYKTDWLQMEGKLDKSLRKPDIIIDDKMGKKLIVEIKKPNRTLNSKDIEQVATYLSISNVEWGILTNGLEWILINHSTLRDAKFIDKVVAKVKLNFNKPQGDEHPKNLKYFSYIYLFEKEFTRYQRDLQQFKIYQYTEGKDTSWNQYKSAVKRLAEYMEERRNYYLELDKLHLNDFIDYFKWLASNPSNSNRSLNKHSTNEKKLKEATVKSQYRYLRTFFKRLNEKKFYSSNPLEFVTAKDIINRLGDIVIPKEKDKLEVTHEIIESVFEQFEKGHNPLRDRLMFSLILIGLDRKEVSQLREKDFNYETLIITDTVKTRKLKLPLGLSQLINEYLVFKKQKQIKSDYLICKSSGEPLKEGSISWTINNAIKEVSDLNLEKIQQYLIRQYIIDTKDVISLVYLTGFDFSKISHILSWDEVSNLANNGSRLFKKHPFNSFFE